MLDLSAVILAGGQNSRMNYKNKAFLKLGDEIFIERIIKEVKNFRQIIISTNDTFSYIDFEAELVKDIYPRQGPLSGIHAGLIKSDFTYSLVAAFDMPFIKSGLLEYLASKAPGYDAVVPRKGSFCQPLCAVYSKTCLPFIEANLKHGIRKISSFYRNINIRYVDEDELKPFGDYEHIFRNINTQRDYDDYCSTIA